jgi:hypothetical protein
VEDIKEALANKLDKLEKKVQKYRKTINLFIRSDAYRDHKILEVYI